MLHHHHLWLLKKINIGLLNEFIYLWLLLETILKFILRLRNDGNLMTSSWRS
jgi:hypothetical protein